MSDMRPELQQIREALEGSWKFRGSAPFPELATVALSAALAALARVEATLNELKAALLAMDVKLLEADYAREDAKEALAAAEARAEAAERELAKRDNRLEMVRENLRHIAVSLPRAVLRQKLEDLAALSSVSATGASGALQNRALGEGARRAVTEHGDALERLADDAGNTTTADFGQSVTARPAPAEPPRGKDA